LEALKGFTSSASFASFDETKLGTLGVGKWADFVLLSKDIVQLSDQEDLVNTKVLKTFLGGRKVFDLEEKLAADAARNEEEEDEEAAAAASARNRFHGKEKARRSRPVPVMPNSAVAEDGAAQTPGMWVVGRR
jgi:adenine deaminase